MNTLATLVMLAPLLVHAFSTTYLSIRELVSAEVHFEEIEEHENSRHVAKGRLTMCLDRIDLVNGVIPQRELDSQVFIQMHEIGHILGVGSDLFQFYTNPSTGEPYGVRRGDFPCVEEGGGTIDTLPQNVQANSYGEGDRERLFYEVTTPTVTRVVQNKFGCDTITGARLENQPTSGGRIGRCIGVHFDERLFYDDLMGAIANQVPCTVQSSFETQQS